VLLNREGWKVEKKLAYHLYNKEGLTLRHKPRKEAAGGDASSRAFQADGTH